MRLLKNPEVKRYCIVYGIITIASTILGYTKDKETGAWAFGLCILFIALYLINAGKRYKDMANLVLEIDKLLHGEEQINLAKYHEGELSLLQSELIKLTVKLREQADMLKKDKIKLADSMADISHQIRTPLTSINLMLSILKKDNLSDEKRVQYIKELTKMIGRIDWLIEALLKMSKLDAGTVLFKKEVVTLKDVIEQAVSPFLIPMEVMEQELIVKADGKFNGDIAWTVEAIGNIMKNCVEHMGQGGVLSIKAEENSVYSEFVIQDTGSGILEEDLPHIFERFYKGKKENTQSVGIGLALARTIIVHQNGTIKAENCRDSGAKFTVRFYKGVI